LLRVHIVGGQVVASRLYFGRSNVASGLGLVDARVGFLSGRTLASRTDVAAREHLFWLLAALRQYHVLPSLSLALLAHRQELRLHVLLSVPLAAQPLQLQLRASVLLLLLHLHVEEVLEGLVVLAARVGTLHVGECFGRGGFGRRGGWAALVVLQISDGLVRLVVLSLCAGFALGEGQVALGFGLAGLVLVLQEVISMCLESFLHPLVFCLPPTRHLLRPCALLFKLKGVTSLSSVLIGLIPPAAFPALQLLPDPLEV